MCGLTLEQMKNQVEPELAPVRKIHLYHCDHRGLPLALIDINGHIAWSAESDEWGNVLREDNQHNLQQLIRLPGQQWDKESGLYYNRHRYYDPAQGRYITQDPVGLKGGLNPYTYPLNPITDIDPLGLATLQQIMGANAYGTMQGANVGLDPNLSDEERSKAADDFANMRGMYNPLDQYVKRLAFGLPSMPLLVMFSPAASLEAAFTGAGLSCGSNSAYQLYKGDKFNYKDAALAALTGFLAPGRNLLENTLISMGVTFLNKDGKTGATSGAGVGTVVSDIMGKLAPSYIPDAVVEFGGGVASEYIGDKSEEIFDTEDEKK